MINSATLQVISATSNFDAEPHDSCVTCEIFQNFCRCKHFLIQYDLMTFTLTVYEILHSLMHCSPNVTQIKFLHHPLNALNHPHLPFTPGANIVFFTCCSQCGNHQSYTLSFPALFYRRLFVWDWNPTRGSVISYSIKSPVNIVASKMVFFFFSWSSKVWSEDFMFFAERWKGIQYTSEIRGCYNSKCYKWLHSMF